MTRNKQHGAVLFLALMLMVALTLLVLSAVRAGNTNLRIAGNMQMQGETAAAAQQAIEQVISFNFTSNPVATSIPVTNGLTTYTVNVAQPVCLVSLPILNNDPALPPTCINSGSQNTGIFNASGVPSTGTPSMCYTQQWDVQATVLDNSSGATTTLHQGVGLKVPVGTVCL